MALISAGGAALAARMRRGLARVLSVLRGRGPRRQRAPKIEVVDDLPRVRVRPDAKPITNEDVRRALEDWP